MFASPYSSPNASKARVSSKPLDIPSFAASVVSRVTIGPGSRCFMTEMGCCQTETCLLRFGDILDRHVKVRDWHAGVEAKPPERPSPAPLGSGLLETESETVIGGDSGRPWDGVSKIRQALETRCCFPLNVRIIGRLRRGGHSRPCEPFEKERFRCP